MKTDDLKAGSRIRVWDSNSEPIEGDVVFAKRPNDKVVAAYIRHSSSEHIGEIPLNCKNGDNQYWWWVGDVDDDTYYRVQVIERDWTKASPEELIEEAKRRYPVGTKVQGLYGQYFVIDNYVRVSDGNIQNGNICTLYYLNTNKWAEIISLPEKTDGYIPIKDRKIGVYYSDHGIGREIILLYEKTGVDVTKTVLNHSSGNIFYHKHYDCLDFVTDIERWDKQYKSICIAEFRQMVEEELRRGQYPYKVEGNSMPNEEFRTLDEYMGILNTTGNSINSHHKPKTTNNEHKKGKTVSVSKITPKVCRPERGRGKEVSGRRCGFTVEIGSTSDRTVHYKR